MLEYLSYTLISYSFIIISDTIKCNKIYLHSVCEVQQIGEKYNSCKSI